MGRSFIWAWCIGQYSDVIYLGKRWVTLWMLKGREVRNTGFLGKLYFIHSQRHISIIFNRYYTDQVQVLLKCSRTRRCCWRCLQQNLFLVWSASKALWPTRLAAFEKRKLVPSVSNFANAQQIILQVYNLSYYQNLWV